MSSHKQNDSVSLDTKESSSVPQDPGRGSKPQPGKGASQRKSDQRRKKINHEGNQEIRREIDRTLFAPYAVFDEIQKKIGLDTHLHTAFVAVTTRGIGLWSRTCLEFAMLHSAKQVRDSHFDASILYRITLAQLAVQMNASDKARGTTAPLPAVNPGPTFLASELLAMMLRQVDNFTPLAVIVNSIGSFKYADKHITCYVHPHPARTEPPPSDGRAVRLPSIVPNPFTVTFHTLRQVVEALSTAHTPAAERQFFRRYNPIPACQWSEADVLLNPDDIMPPVYGESRLYEDIRRFHAYMSSAVVKLHRNLSTLSYSGTGHEACLPFIAIPSGNIVDLPTELTNYCFVPLNSAPMMVNLLGLFREMHDSSFGVDGYGDGQACMSAAQFQYSWTAGASTLLH